MGPNKSVYLLSLENENKDIADRYKEKIRVIQGMDPFAVSEAVSDERATEIVQFPPVAAIDIVSYLVFKHNFYTKEQMRAFKSSSAHKYFKAGLVENCKARSIGEYIVVLSQVRRPETTNNLLKVWTICKTDGSIVTAHCTCMTCPSEACNHIGAVLYQLEYMHQAAQNAPFASDVPIVPVCEMEEFKGPPHGVSSTSYNKIPPVDVVKFLQKLKDLGCEAALMRIVEPFASEIARSSEPSKKVP